MKFKVLASCFVTLLSLAGCSGGGTTESATGGSSGTGGQTQTGGSGGGSGGSVGSGGTTRTGGTTGAGGTTGTGGSSASGGTTSAGGSGTGGTTATGGRTGTGGSSASGGTTSPGGTGSGGTTATGGTTAKGGNTGGGGTTSTGGTTATGGTTSRGGADGGAGGTTGKGGAMGGTTGTGGGTSVTVGASGYPAAGASGQTQPSGTGSKVTVLPWAGFKGAISLTHDDTNQSQIDNYSKLQALNDKGNNARFTFYMQTGKTAQMSSSVWTQAVKDGHELGNHTKSHSPPANTSDIQAAEDTLKSMFGVTAYSFAAPNGDNSYVSAIPTMKEFLTNRTAGNSGGIAFTDNPSSKQWQLPCIIPATNASSSAMASPLNQAVSAGQWEINLVHGFNGSSGDGAYQPVDIDQYTAAVTAVKATGNAWIDTVGNVSAYWIAGYNFSKLTPTTSGTDKTWTWKTSDFNNPFPPGHYLRVTTDGGVLKQGSTVLQWDDHGYYEVSLDAGTLTLSSQ